MTKEALYGKDINELLDVTHHLGLPGFSAKQIAGWLYRHEISSIDEMTNIPKKIREVLASEYEIGIYPPDSFVESSDGTKKYLFKVRNGKYIETAYIPEKGRATVCVSTQAGCRMGCRFCMTGKQGFQGNLSAGEILNQIRSINEFRKITNVVYMGMGEPLDNLPEVVKSLDILTSEWGYGWSPTRITVSTVGISGSIGSFLQQTRVHLAVSLHTPFPGERLKLIPVEKTSPVGDIIQQIRQAGIKGQRRISFEYILFRGFNDSSAHVNELARLLNGIRCRVNLIRFHKVPGLDYESPDIEEIKKFRDKLNSKGIIATIRASRGEDINAACGLLSTLSLNKNQE